MYSINDPFYSFQYTGPANIISILCIRKKLQRHTQIDKILLSLAVSDTLVCVTALPLKAWFEYWESISFLHPITIRCLSYWVLALTNNSTLTVTILAAVKYFKIAADEKFKTIVTEFRLRTAICLCWLFPILLMIPNITERFPNSMMSAMRSPINILSRLCTFLGLVLLPIFYFLIYRIFKRSRRRIADISTTTRKSKREMKQRHQLVKR